ncbi:MAG: hypothetical protein COA94_03265 [Rickettsiales bacterium]|nr:MAG: hypothetical protein COA94_03265 [Rickettsiales bacterium]
MLKYYSLENHTDLKKQIMAIKRASKINSKFKTFERMKFWRKQRGFSQTEFARKISKPQPHVSQLESGNRGVTDDWMHLYADALNVSPIVFFEAGIDPISEKISADVAQHVKKLTHPQKIKFYMTVLELVNQPIEK